MSRRITKDKNMQKKIFTLRVTTPRAVMIIAFNDFKDQEYFVPREVFEKAGFQIITASFKNGIARGSEGGEAEVDILVKNADAKEYEAVVFVGGPGAFKYLDDADAHKLAQSALKQNKILGAICIAPVALAKAGVLKNKNATVWSSSMDKSAVRELEKNGANYKDQNVVQDNRIITANGPEAAREFGEAIVRVLLNSYD